MLNQNQNQEVWKVAKYNDEIFPDYEVSSLGRVRSYKYKQPKILKPDFVKGYSRVRLFKDNKPRRCLIHRLVICSHQEVPKNFEELQVNHIDENPRNSRLSNLEWVTPSQNVNHATRNARVSKAMTNRKDLSKTVYQFTLAGEFVREWASLHEIERQLGFLNGNISNCCNGKYKTSYGYIWSYTKEFQTD